LGTPDTLTDKKGNIAWSVSYQTYGNLAIKHEGESFHQPIRFQGQYADEETGLHYNRFRYYDPAIGQFITQDPVGLAGGNNNYRYAPNPLEWIDPYGLTAKSGDCEKKYRALTKEQEAQALAGEPISPKDKTAAYTVQEHIDDGRLKTQYNSLGSKKAANFYSRPNPKRGKMNKSVIIEVDTQKIKSSKVHDVSKGIDPTTGDKLSDPGYRYARKDKEVLVEGEIPVDAYRIIDND
ncbi:RHS repeat-associated core domain-containing protein, partial [Marinibactrum halimedae]